MHDYDVVWSRESIYDVADIEIETVFLFVFFVTKGTGRKCFERESAIPLIK